MRTKNYIVSDLRPIRDVENSFFQAHYCVYEFGLTHKSVNVANFIDKNKEELQQLWNFSEKKYNSYVDILGERLNNLHKTNYSKEFWQRVFSTSLLHHITLVHQFYNYVKKNFDSNVHSCEILNEKSYKISNSYDELRDFLSGSSIGQEQLFSIYINLFYKNRYSEFSFFEKDLKEDISYDFNKYFKLKNYSYERILKKMNNLVSTLFLSKSKRVKVGLMGCYFHPDYFKILQERSFGKIQIIPIPTLNSSKYVDFLSRDLISKIDDNMDNFDKFFFHSLKYLMPKHLIENFKGTIKRFDIILRNYKNISYILSEAWTSSSSINLFRAIAFEKNDIKTYYNEHNCILHPFVGNYVKFQSKLIDKYLTLGWKTTEQKFISLSSLFNFTHTKKDKKYDILYVSNPALYQYSFYSSSSCHSGAGAVKQLEFVKKFFFNIKPNILKKISYRSYPKDYNYKRLQYDKEKFLESYLKHVSFVSSLKFKGESCKEQMAASSLVIVDFLSTSYLEALKMNIPLICFCDKNSMYLDDKYLNFFDDLIQAKIVHTTPESAAEHLKDIHENPLKWWNMIKTQDLKKRWLNKNFGNPDDMVGYLLKLSKQN